VNSALQRARATLAEVGDTGEITEPHGPGGQAVIGRYVRAFEAADVPALVRLLTEEAVLEMPPMPLWYRGSRNYGLFIRRIFEMARDGLGHAPPHRQRPARARRVRARTRGRTCWRRWSCPARAVRQ
jgi:RNA polymerase sigma-70 factor, ECF subfamily